MPTALVTSFAKKSGKSEEEVDKLFKKAMVVAMEQGKKESDEDFFPLVTGILKKMLKLETPTITTTSVGNSATLGGSANFANKMGANRKKEKKIEKKFKKFMKKTANG